MRLGLLLIAITAQAADLTFTGSLRSVTPSSVSLRLPDGQVIDARLPKTGDLAAAKLAAQFKLADQVQVSYKGISSVWDASVKRFHSLELTRIHFLRAASPEELTHMSASLSWHFGGNLLKPEPPTLPPPPVSNPAGLDRVRDVNLARAAKMPNFVADERAVRTFHRKGEVKWKPMDVVESEVAFHGDGAARQRVRINGKPYSSVSGWIPGPNWGPEFGDVLKPLLERDCANTFELAGRDQRGAKQLTRYSFHSPLDGCFGEGIFGFRSFSPAKKGSILVDPSSADVFQIEVEDYAPTGELSGIRSVLTWDNVSIGDASYLLPVAADFVYVFADGGVWHVAVEYKNHRHFEASTDITFHP